MAEYLGINPTGFCWKCGRQIKEGELFCNQKHREQFLRQRKAQEHTGKKDNYGLAGSTH